MKRSLLIVVEDWDETYILNVNWISMWEREYEY